MHSRFSHGARGAFLLVLGAALLSACGEDEGDGTNGGSGSLIVPDLSGPLLRLDPAQLTVDRSMTLVLSRTDLPGDRNPFNGETAEERKDTLYALDYQTGEMRLLIDEPTDGRLNSPLLLVSGGDQPHYVTFLGSLADSFLNRVELGSSGEKTAVAIQAYPETCAAIAGDDFYFVGRQELRVARDFMTETQPVTFESLADKTACGLGIFSLDGQPVRLDRTAGFGGAESFVLSALDPQSAEAEPGPLAEIPVSGLSTDVRPPLFAVADEGFYVLATDFVDVELWRAGYARRPGLLAGTDAPPAATRLGSFDVSFFSELVFGGGAISIDSIFGFSVRDNVLALGVRILEDAADGRFTYAALLMADLETEDVDLISFGTVHSFELFATP